MKRLAIFIGGLLVLPAFAEVAPIFIDEENALEYTDAMYDENGFLIIPDAEVVEEVEETAAQKPQTPVKISRAPVNATPVANRSTSTRATPTASRTNTSGRGNATGNSSRVVAARTTTNASGRGNTSRAVASRGAMTASPRTTTTAATSSTRTTTNTAATRAAAARATGGSARSTTATVSGTGVARTATTAGRTATTTRAGTARTATTTTAARAATTTTGAARPSVRTNQVGAGVKDNQIGPTLTLGTVTNDGVLYKESKAASIRRTPTLRMSTLNSASADANSISMSMEDMDDLAEMTDYCKAQYANCMDNYCNVLDDNQGRCSCSANLKNYAKAEAALKTATEELQDVAQKIQYIGLTTREVETLFTQTEAELAMQSKTDSSQLQASLNKVKDMIVEVKTGTATSDTNTGLSFDLSGLLEFSFDSTGFDLMSLFGTSNTGSVSNQRGEELYKTASSRCKTSVIKACTARGVDASLITNAYDLEIDRECIMYERSLNDSNDEMLATVRNAKNVLQKARLMVAQQKNAYDMRGCINALDACMQDEFVCGSDYENCLDPTGRYIVNGEIVIGSQPGHAIDPENPGRVASVMTSDVCRVNLYRTWDFPDIKACREHDGSASGDVWAPNYMDRPITYDQGNAWGSGAGDNLVAYIEETVTANAAKNASENMSQYLQNKIGYVNQKDGRAYGMCISVLNKCQDYTYTGKGTSAKYNPQNDVIKQYLGRVLVQIKSKQDEILANYAETCVSDVTSCLSQNGYPSDDPLSWDPSEYTTNITKMNIAINACRAQVVTCMSVNGYSIDTPTPTEMNCWVQGLLFNYTTEDCREYHSSTISCGPSAYGLCKSQPACEEAGGTWCNGYCYEDDSQCGGGSGGDNCQVTLARGLGCGTGSSITIPCNKTTSTDIHGFVSDDNGSLQTWNCSGNNDTLEDALNGLGNETGLGTLSRLDAYGISQSTTCTAVCYTDGGTNGYPTVKISCGSGNTFNSDSGSQQYAEYIWTSGTSNSGVFRKNGISSTGNNNFAFTLHGGYCNKPGTGDAVKYDCNPGGEKNAENSVNVSTSVVCSAVYSDGSSGDGDEDISNNPKLTIDCGNGSHFSYNSSDSHPGFNLSTLSGQIGKFTAISSQGGNFTLKAGYCKNSDNANASSYTCTSGENKDAGDVISVTGNVTCTAGYNGSGGDNCQVTLARGSGCGTGSSITIPCNKTTSTDIHGFVSDDNSSLQTWNCSGNNNTLEDALNELGNGAGIGTLGGLSNYGISQSVVCTATCSDDGGGSGGDNCQVTLARGLGCGTGSSITIPCNKTTSTDIHGFVSDDNGSLQTWNCSGNNDTLEDALNGLGNETGLGTLSRLDAYGISQSTTCTAVCYTDGGTNGYPTVKISCGSGNTFNSDSGSQQYAEYIWTSGTSNSGVFRKNGISSTGNNNFVFTLHGGYCNKPVTGNAQRYQCGSNDPQDAGITITVTGNITCSAFYSSSDSEGSDVVEECINAPINENYLLDNKNLYPGTVSGNRYVDENASGNFYLSEDFCDCPEGTTLQTVNVSSPNKTRGINTNSHDVGTSLTLGPNSSYIISAQCVPTGGGNGCEDDEEYCPMDGECYPNATFYENCYTNENYCETNGGIWCDGVCHTPPYNCNPGGDCSVTLQPGANCPAGQSATIVSCNMAKTNAPRFFEDFGAQTWSCNPSNVISNLSDLNNTYGGLITDGTPSNGTGSAQLTGTAGTCTANCIPGGYVDIVCGEGTLKQGAQTHFVPVASLGVQTTTGNYSTVNLGKPSNYCNAPSNKVEDGWSCYSNITHETGSTEVIGSSTPIPVYPDEVQTCTAQWQDTTPSQTCVRTFNCGTGCSGTDATSGETFQYECDYVKIRVPSCAAEESQTMSWNCGGKTALESFLASINPSTSGSNNNNQFWTNLSSADVVEDSESFTCTATCSGSTPQYNFSSITLQGASIE